MNVDQVLLLKAADRMESRLQETLKGVIQQEDENEGQGHAAVTMDVGMYSEIGHSDQQASNNPVIARPASI